MFPEKSKTDIDVWISLLEKIGTSRKNGACRTYQEGTILGFPGTYPLPISSRTFNYVMEFNPNNIMLHAKASTIQPQAEAKERGAFAPYHEFEREVIAMLGTLLGGNPGGFSGYITSGGTEANIYALWLARNWILKKTSSDFRSTQRIKALVPLSAHYSIFKALNLLGLSSTDPDGREQGNLHLIDVGPDYRVDIKDLHARLGQTLRDKDTLGVIISLTAGTTSTGAFDDVSAVDRILADFKEAGNTKPVYVHVDAAFGGLVTPFVGDILNQYEFIREVYGRGFSPPQFDFSIPNVSSVTVDPHKMGMTPYPSGVLLYRGELHDVIGRRVEYIADERDETLIGSRPGASAAACWAAFTCLGKAGYQRVLKRCLGLTNELVTELRRLLSIEIAGQPMINYFAFRFSSDFVSQLTPELLDTWDNIVVRRYCLIKSLCYRTKTEVQEVTDIENRISSAEEKEKSTELERYRVYRMVIMPHVTTDAVGDFLETVKGFVEEVKDGKQKSN